MNLPANTARRWRLPSNHPVFAGHFPNHPIVPGALLLNMVLHSITDRPGHPSGPIRIVNAKFLRPVGPDSPIDVILLGWPDEPIQRFTIRVGEHTVATGTIIIGATGPHEHFGHE